METYHIWLDLYQWLGNLCCQYALLDCFILLADVNVNRQLACTRLSNENSTTRSLLMANGEAEMNGELYAEFSFLFCNQLERTLNSMASENEITLCACMAR